MPHHFHRMLAVAALCALAGVQGASAQTSPSRSFPFDTNGDAQDETIGIWDSADPTVSTNSVIRVLGPDGTSLVQLPPASGSGVPSGPFDHFGFVVRGVVGLNNASSRELVVCSPLRPGAFSNNYLTPSGLGAVEVYDAGSGSLRQVVFAAAGTRLGLDAADIPDQDGDGVRDLLVAGAEIQSDGRWAPRTFLFSGGQQLRLLTTRPESLGRLVDYANNEGSLYLSGDLDHNGVINVLDMTLMLGVINAPASAAPEADLDHNGVIDAADIQLQIDGYLAGRRSIAAATVFESSQTPWAQFTADWATIYTGQTTVAPVPPPSITSVVGPQPFLGLNVTPCTCAGTPGESPRTCVVGITGCPGLLHMGEWVALTPITESTSCTWSIVGPPGIIAQDPNVPGRFVGISPGIVAVHLECMIGDCCACAECVLWVSPPPGPACNPTIQLLCCGADGKTVVGAGNRYRLYTRATPSGGHFHWTVIPSNPDAVDALHTRLGDWPTAVIAFGQPPAGGGDWPTHPRTVQVIVEYTVPGCPTVSTMCNYSLEADSDHDGLTDWEEINVYHTDPLNPDTDGDGWPDGCEVKLGSDPNDPKSIPPQAYLDTDHDGLSDAEEICKYGTDPYRPDTDGDGVIDLVEVMLGLSTASPPTIQISNAQWLLTSYESMCHGLIPIPWNDPTPTPGVSDLDSPAFRAADKDHDLLPDWYERQRGLDPMRTDSLGDGIPDGIKILAGRDPLVYYPEPLPDTDGDGIPDLIELYITHTDPLNPDTDGDGLPDGWEVKYGLDPNSADTGNTGVPDGLKDVDGDGLSNLEEYRRGLNPTNADTDGDGTTDMQELMQGSDPASASDNGRPVVASSWFNLRIELFSGWGWGISPAASAKVGSVAVSVPENDPSGFAYVDAPFAAGHSYPASCVSRMRFWSDVTGLSPYTPDDPDNLTCRSDGSFLVPPLTTHPECRPFNWVNADCGKAPFHRRFVECWCPTLDCDTHPTHTTCASVYSQDDGGLVVVARAFITIDNDDSLPSGKAAHLHIEPSFLEQEYRETGWLISGIPVPDSDSLRLPLPIGWSIERIEAWFHLWSDELGQLRSQPLVTATNANHNAVFLGGGTVATNQPGLALWIDSDNSHGFERMYGPSNTDPTSAPGKLILVNDGDADGDGIPDWADGIGAYSLDTLGLTGQDPRTVMNILTPGPQLTTPLVFRYALPPGANWTDATVTFDYSASDPNGVSVVPHVTTGLAGDGTSTTGRWNEFLLPPEGSATEPEHLRLWKRSRDSICDPRSVENGGDFIPSGIPVHFSKLATLQGTGEAVLFVEAVRPSRTPGQDHITATITFDGALPTSQLVDVVVTAMRLEIHDLRKWGARARLTDGQLQNHGFVRPYTQDSDYGRDDLDSCVDGAVTDGASICLVRAVPPGVSGELSVRVLNRRVGYSDGFQEYVGGFESNWNQQYPSPGDARLPHVPNNAAIDSADPMPPDPAAQLRCTVPLLTTQNAFYVPPESFHSWATQGKSLNQVRYYSKEEVPVQFQVLIRNTLIGDRTFLLRRPPVVLVHGITGHPNSPEFETDYWPFPAYAEATDSVSFPLPGALDTRVYQANYSETRTKGYDTGFDAVARSIREAVIDYRTSHDGVHDSRHSFLGRRYAATRVDVVGHSMGGQVARLFVSGASGTCKRKMWSGDGPLDNPGSWRTSGWEDIDCRRYPPSGDHADDGRWDYLRDDNWGAGDIRRLCTIGSVYNGSPLGNVTSWMWEPCQIPGNASDYQMAMMVHRQAMQNGGFESTFDAYWPDGPGQNAPTGCADLATNSTMQRILEGSSFTMFGGQGRAASYPTGRAALCWRALAGRKPTDCGVSGGSPMKAILGSLGPIAFDRSTCQTADEFDRFWKEHWVGVWESDPSIGFPVGHFVGGFTEDSDGVVPISSQLNRWFANRLPEMLFERHTHSVGMCQCPGETGSATMADAIEGLFSSNALEFEKEGLDK